MTQISYKHNFAHSCPRRFFFFLTGNATAKNCFSTVLLGIPQNEGLVVGGGTQFHHSKMCFLLTIFDELLPGRWFVVQF